MAYSGVRADGAAFLSLRWGAIFSLQPNYLSTALGSPKPDHVPDALPSPAQLYPGSPLAP